MKKYYVKYSDNEAYGDAILRSKDEITPNEAAEALEKMMGSSGTMIDEFKEATPVDHVRHWTNTLFGAK
jgi:hypothetical protein